MARSRGRMVRVITLLFLSRARLGAGRPGEARENPDIVQNPTGWPAFAGHDIIWRDAGSRMMREIAFAAIFSVVAFAPALSDDIPPCAPPSKAVAYSEQAKLPTSIKLDLKRKF